MIRLLTSAVKAAGLTYSLLSSTMLIALLVHGAYKQVTKK